MTEVDKIIKALNNMFEADHEYGTGFYNSDAWCLEYAKLQKLIGYKKTTSVFDPELQKFYDLPE